MSLAIRYPDFASDTWADVPQEHRTEILAMLRAFETAPAKGRTKWLERLAPTLGTTYGTLKTKFYAYEGSGSDWTVLVNRKKAAISPPELATTREPRFIAYVLQLVEENGRKDQPAFKELRRRWRTRNHQIPGYEDFPGWPSIPEGWSDRNLADIVKKSRCKAAAKAARYHSTSSKGNGLLPHVITTRVGLWPGAVIQLDDQWHDNFVTLGKGKNLQVVRAIELGALDVFSGHRFHWGAKPRRRRADGSMESLGSKEARLFIGGLLHQFGHSTQGCVLMVEHNTMAIPEDIERMLYDYSRGMIRVNRQPIEGKQAAISGFWQGTEGGNFRAKAHLESLHNLIRNGAGHLAMQTGSFSSGVQGPVTTDRQESYIKRIIGDMLKAVPHRASLLRYPTWDFHSQFIPWLTEFYHFGIALRTDHALEGWDALGHVITEFTTAPGSDHFLSEAEFLALEDVSRMIIGEQARKAPDKWTRRRKLSPLEVWNRRPAFQAVPPSVICDILTRDLAREVKADRGFLRFQDQEFAPEPLIYEATYITGPQRGRSIGHGEKVLMFANPYDDTRALAVDAQGRFLGELPLYKRILSINPDAFGTDAPFDYRPDVRSPELLKAAGHKAERIADVLAPIRIRHEERGQDARDLREWNKDVLNPTCPVTGEEIAAARIESAERGAKTRLRRKVESHAASLAQDVSLDAWSDRGDTAANPFPTEDAEADDFNPFTD